MALERVGIGGVFTFQSSQAVRAFAQARDSLGKFGRTEDKTTASTQRLSSSVTKMTAQFRKAGQAMGQAMSQGGAALRSLGIAGLPATAALGFAVKQAANFEQAMANVNAVLLDTSDEGMAQLTAKAKKMGATTVFTATQSANAMQSLARQGFNVSETMDAIGGTLAAAAAEGADLTQITEIVANTVRAMGLEAERATNVADTLAITSAKSGTNIVQLGNAMKFAIPQANAMGVSLDVVSAVLGSLGDAGLKGTIAGTSFTNMLVKLTKPTKKATAMTKLLGAEIFEFKDGNLDLVKTLRSYADGLKDITSKTKRAGIISEIFGLRGQKAINAIDKALSSGRLFSLLEQTKEQFDGAGGAAQRMADIRLDTFEGQLTLLKSAAEGFNIEVGGLLLDTLTGGSKSSTTALQQVVLVLQELNTEAGLTKKQADEAGPTLVAVAQGIRDAFTDLRDAITDTRASVVELARTVGLELGGQSVRETTALITKMLLFAAVLAPIALAVGGIAFVIAQVAAAATALSGVFLAIGGILGGIALGPVLLILAGFALIGTAAFLMWDSIKAGFDQFILFAQPGIDFVTKAFEGFALNVQTFFMEMWTTIKQIFKFIEPLVTGVFEAIGESGGQIFNALLTIIGSLVTSFGNLLVELGRIARFLIGGIVNTVQLIAKGIVALRDAVGTEVPSALRKFAEQDQFKLFAHETPGAIDPLAEREKNARSATDTVVAQKQAAGEAPKVEAKVEITDKSCLEIQNSVALDGRDIASNQAKHKQEVNERAGFKATPWQRRVTLEQGSAPVGGGLGSG